MRPEIFLIYLKTQVSFWKNYVGAPSGVTKVIFLWTLLLELALYRKKEEKEGEREERLKTRKNISLEAEVE